MSRNRQGCTHTLHQLIKRTQKRYMSELTRKLTNDECLMLSTAWLHDAKRLMQINLPRCSNKQQSAVAALAAAAAAASCRSDPVMCKHSSSALLVRSDSDACISPSSSIQLCFLSGAVTTVVSRKVIVNAAAAAPTCTETQQFKAVST
eukprot:13446-Heterococcus_DN1.PRE.1